MRLLLVEVFNEQLQSRCHNVGPEVRSPKVSSFRSSNDLAVLSMKCNVFRILGRFFARPMCDRTLIQLSWISRKRNKETFILLDMG